jgi:hypothetical protein
MTIHDGITRRSLLSQTDLLSYSPDLDDDELDAAVNLHTYMSG